jgi:hypothetical protein
MTSDTVTGKVIASAILMSFLLVDAYAADRLYCEFRGVNGAPGMALVFQRTGHSTMAGVKQVVTGVAMEYEIEQRPTWTLEPVNHFLVASAPDVRQKIWIDMSQQVIESPRQPASFRFNDRFKGIGHCEVIKCATCK